MIFQSCKMLCKNPLCKCEDCICDPCECNYIDLCPCCEPGAYCDDAAEDIYGKNKRNLKQFKGVKNENQKV